MTDDVQEQHNNAFIDDEQGFIENEEEETSENDHQSKTSKISYIIQ